MTDSTARINLTSNDDLKPASESQIPKSSDGRGAEASL